jgi:phosphatidate cytidylyltransferase
MKEIGIRAATGAVYVGLTLLAACLGAFATLILFLPVSWLAAGELHDLLNADQQGIERSRGLAVAAYLTFGITAAVPIVEPGWMALAALAIAIVAVCLLLARNPEQPGKALGNDLLMILLIGAPFALLSHLVAIDHTLMIGIMILLWTNETGAYLTGKFLGKHKMIPSISPKKTWEGLIGGMAFTLLFAWFISMAWSIVGPAQWLVIAVIVAVLSTVGDLFESALKRARGVKDAGNILPGHGGILDRFDGLLLVAPGVWTYLLLVL